MYLLFKIIGYFAWITTTGLGVAGSWLWNFTTEHPTHRGKRALTRPGRYAIVVMAVSLSCAIASTVYTGACEYQERLAQAQERMEREKEKAP